MSHDPIPPHYLAREDESDDSLFYAGPRLVTHIDDATIAALTQVYRERLPPSAAVLDLMSSWVSHLPEAVVYSRVAGLGMNRAELEANPRLHDFAVHDLNATPTLPYPDESFDAVLNAVSVQYLTRPVEVFAEVARVLRPGREHLVAVSHRVFPTKAIALFLTIPPEERPGVVAVYFRRSGAFDEPTLLDRSPPGADPLWVVCAVRRGGGEVRRA